MEAGDEVDLPVASSASLDAPPLREGAASPHLLAESTDELTRHLVAAKAASTALRRHNTAVCDAAAALEAARRGMAQAAESQAAALAGVVATAARTAREATAAQAASRSDLLEERERAGAALVRAKAAEAAAGQLSKDLDAARGESSRWHREAARAQRKLAGTCAAASALSMCQAAVLRRHRDAAARERRDRAAEMERLASALSSRDDSLAAANRQIASEKELAASRELRLRQQLTETATERDELRLALAAAVSDAAAAREEAEKEKAAFRDREAALEREALDLRSRLDEARRAAGNAANKPAAAEARARAAARSGSRTRPGSGLLCEEEPSGGAAWPAARHAGVVLLTPGRGRGLVPETPAAPPTCAAPAPPTASSGRPFAEPAGCAASLADDPPASRAAGPTASAPAPAPRGGVAVLLHPLERGKSLVLQPGWLYSLSRGDVAAPWPRLHIPEGPAGAAAAQVARLPLWPTSLATAWVKAGSGREPVECSRRPWVGLAVLSGSPGDASGSGVGAAPPRVVLVLSSRAGHGSGRARKKPAPFEAALVRHCASSAFTTELARVALAGQQGEAPTARPPPMGAEERAGPSRPATWRQASAWELVLQPAGVRETLRGGGLCPAGASPGVSSVGMMTLESGDVVVPRIPSVWWPEPASTDSRCRPPDEGGSTPAHPAFADRASFRVVTLSGDAAQAMQLTSACWRASAISRKPGSDESASAPGNAEAGQQRGIRTLSTLEGTSQATQARPGADALAAAPVRESCPRAGNIGPPGEQPASAQPEVCGRGVDPPSGAACCAAEGVEPSSPAVASGVMCSAAEGGIPDESLLLEMEAFGGRLLSAERGTSTARKPRAARRPRVSDDDGEGGGIVARLSWGSGEGSPVIGLSDLAGPAQGERASADSAESGGAALVVSAATSVAAGGCSPRARGRACSPPDDATGFGVGDDDETVTGSESAPAPPVRAAKRVRISEPPQLAPASAKRERIGKDLAGVWDVPMEPKTPTLRAGKLGLAGRRPSRR